MMHDTKSALRGGLDLPPPYSLLTLRERDDAFVHAKRVAPDAGAGTLVWVRRFDVVEFAVVLEPDEPWPGAGRALFAGMNALGDALTVHAPPERLVSFDWPDAVRIDGGLLGGGRLGAPEDVARGRVPEWLVFGATLRTVVMGLRESDDWAGGTALEVEGFEDLDAGAIVESFARHLMVQFDLWHERGFAPVAEQYLARLAPQHGATRGIDIDGALLVRHGDARPDRRPLDAAAVPGWLDPAHGLPWL